jgi:hypothetical protein
LLVATRLTDAVEKVGFSFGVSLYGGSGSGCDEPAVGFEVARSATTSTRTRLTQSKRSQVNDARRRIFGGPRILRASILRFCTMAARWNSSRVPAFKAMVNLQMSKAHLDALALVA